MRALVVIWIVAAASCGDDGAQVADAALADAKVTDAAPDALVHGFAPKLDLAAGMNPTFAALADIDGDGKLDIVTANTNGTTVSVLRNTSTAGVVSFAARIDFTVGQAPACVIAVDLDGDGKLDLATANVGAGTASVLINQSTAGAPMFGAAVTLTVGTAPEYIAAGDLDGDGKRDLATANIGDNTISVLRNTTSGPPTFAAKLDLATDTGPLAVAIADLDGDGKLDLATGNLNANDLTVRLNTTTAVGPPTFGASVQVPTGAMPGALLVADLDGDGKRDLATASESTATVSVLRNTTASGASSPTFAAKVDTATGAMPDGLAAADLDGDGRTDLVTADFGASTVSLLSATSTGFAAPVALPAGGAARAVEIADVDGDGRRDLVVANGTANTVSILLGR